MHKILAKYLEEAGKNGDEAERKRIEGLTSNAEKMWKIHKKGG